MSKAAAEFADEWIAAWNSLDLDRILSHYAENVLFTSPRAAARMPQTKGTVSGITHLREYWAPVSQLRANLKFTLETVLKTVHGCTILYRDESGLLLAETMLFDPAGKVVRGIVSYPSE